MDGSLANLPLEHDAYHDRFDKNRWGLMTVAQVQSYRGFVFGCFDENAPPLLDYLGEMAWYMDTFCDSAGGAELIGPPMKSILHCNWKVPTENFIGDAYHIGWTHAAVLSSIGGGGARADGGKLRIATV
ncbi:SRPBCC family protein [Immundisolibacter sp.]